MEISDGVGLFTLLIYSIIILGGFALFIYVLIDVIKSEFTNNINKIIWLILVLFTGPIGIVLYLIIGKKQKIINGS